MTAEWETLERLEREFGITPPARPQARKLLPGWVTADSVADEPVEFLHFPYLVQGALNLAVGDPGIGKSLWTADIAARVSQGRETIDRTGRFTPADVLIISAEDPASVIRSRLDAAGADLHRVIVREQGSSVALIQELGPVITATGARLVVIDPLMAYIKGDPFKDSEARQFFLGPMAHIAGETGAAILFVTHPTKAFTGDLVRQSAGTIGIVGAVRSGLFFARDPGDPDTRVMAHFKANYSVAGPSLDFTIADGPVIVPGSERPEFYRGQGLVVAQPTGSYPAQPSRPNPMREAARAARKLVAESGGYADSKAVRQYVSDATGFVIPAEGSGLQAFLRAAGFRSEPTYTPGKRGRTGSLWLLTEGAGDSPEVRS